MAISQADFYAFSQATGSPVPEDPEGRAALAPYVMEWRRNQLKQPRQEEQGPNLLQTVGGLATAAGVGTLAFLGARRLAGRRGVQPVNVVDMDEAVRRAAQPIPQLQRGTGAGPGAGTARPPIPRQPAPSSGPSPTPTATQQVVQRVATAPNPWDLPTDTGAIRDITQAAREVTPITRALPPAEPEYVAYRPDPREMVSADVAEARRKAATANLLEASRRTGAYQPEISGVGGTLMALRSPVGALAEETGELVAQAESRPLSAAPAQLNLLSYVKEAAEPQGDAVDRLLTEYNQLVEGQARADRRAQASVRQYRMEQQGKAMRVIDDLRRESLTENQQAKRAFNVDQAINALDSGEDQMTGRVRQQLQRNEDTNLALIDQAEDRTNNIDVAASMTPDGVPVDQAETAGRIDKSLRETSAARFMEAERQKIASELERQELSTAPGRVERELARRLGPEASSYGPKYSARRQALELFSKTGDIEAAERIKRFGLSPVEFETFENMPAEKRRLFETRPPMSLEGYPSEELRAVVPKSGIQVNVPGQGLVDISELRKPVVTEDTALTAEDYIQGRLEKDRAYVEGLKAELQPEMNEIFSERRAIIERQAALIKPQLEQAQMTGNRGKAQELEGQLNALRYQFRNPESHPHRREESNRIQARIGGAQRKIAANALEYERKYPTTLSDWSGEANRVFGELDVDTGEFIPETMELRAERRALDIGEKGGGGRNVGEFTAGERLDEEIRAIRGGGRIRDYDPETGAAVSPWSDDRTQTGRELGIYGVRLSGQKADNPELRPSVPQYTQDEIEAEAMRLAQADPYGDVPMAPEYATVVESLGSQPKTPESRRAIDVSTELRRLQTSGRPGAAQAFLDKMMKQRGVSGVSGTYSRI